MSFLDNAKKLAEDAKKLASEHPATVKNLVDHAEKLADQETGGKYNSQIGKAGQKIDEQIDSGKLGQRPGQSGQ